MDPFLSDRHVRWHPVDLSLFPLRLSIITISLTFTRLAWILCDTGVKQMKQIVKGAYRCVTPP